MKKNNNILPLKKKSTFHFGMYNHKLVIQDSRLVVVKMVVIRDLNKEVVRFTRLHNYLTIGKNKTSVRIDANSGNKGYFVCRMLNYLLVENSMKYKISRIQDITCKHLQDFMYDYSMNHEDDLRYPTQNTLDMCVYAIIDFMENYLEVHDRKRWRKKEFYKIVSKYNKKKHRYEEKKVPTFDVVYNGKTKKIFRDMPNSVFNLILSYASTHYKEIFFMMVVSAFTGMRPSEVCNVRQESSPLGKGLYIYKKGNKIQKIKFDLNEEKQLRSDLVPVGGIKKERWQEVYHKFYRSFMEAYEIHKEYLAEQKFETEFGPMFVDSHGMAMTYNNYYRIFVKMIDEMKPMLVNHSDDEISSYGHLLLQNNISPHIFRHWFSVKLVLYGEEVPGLQHWRGDKSPQSAINYLKNKGELVKQLAHTNEEMFELMLDAATEIFKNDK